MKGGLKPTLHKTAPDQDCDDQSRDEKTVECDDARDVQKATFAPVFGIDRIQVSGDGSMRLTDPVLIDHPRQFWILNQHVSLRQKQRLAPYFAREKPTGTRDLLVQTPPLDPQLRFQQGSNFSDLRL